MNFSFWQGKTVFLTGHTGFKGGWLSLWLHALGAKVIGYGLPPCTQPSLFDLAHIDSHIKSHIADVRDAANLKAAVLESAPDIIFHLAAQPLVRYSYDNPIETYATNVMGTVNMLEAMRASNTAKVLVNITTDKCYENKEWHWGYRETDALGGYDPYSSSKACAEIATASYRSSYFNPKAWDQHGKAIATVRAGNVFGGGDWSQDRLVPDMVRALLSGNKPLIRNPHAKRPWQHVLEPLYGYLMLAEKMWDSPTFADSWNFGPVDDGCKSVGWLANQFCREWGSQETWVHTADESLHEASFLKLDISKANSKLGWYPQLTLSKGLELTAAWYKEWVQGKPVLETTLEQIALYSNQLENTHA